MLKTRRSTNLSKSLNEIQKRRQVRTLDNNLAKTNFRSNSHNEKDNQKPHFPLLNHNSKTNNKSYKRIFEEKKSFEITPRNKPTRQATTPANSKQIEKQKLNQNNLNSNNNGKDKKNQQLMQAKSSKNNKKKMGMKSLALRELNEEIREIINYKIAKQVGDEYKEQDLSKNMAEEDMHIFLDYTKDSSSKFGLNGYYFNSGSNPYTVNRNRNKTNKTNSSHHISNEILHENEYLRKKVELLQMENSNIHSKLRKLEERLNKSLK
jgi:hypothetical protein